MRIKGLFVMLALVTVVVAGFSATKIVIAGRDGTYGQALQLAVDLYRAEHPNVDIELLKLPYSGLYEKLVIDLVERIGAYDIIMLDEVWTTEFMSQGWLADLEALGFQVDQDLISTLVALGRYPDSQGVLYAVPHVGNVELFAYRKDLFEKYGLPTPPQSWLEVLGAAAVIDRFEPNVSGVAFRGLRGNPVVSTFLPIFWSFGADVLRDEMPTVASPEGIAALKFLITLKDYAPTGVEIFDASAVRDALQNGDVAMATEVWPAWVPALDDPAVSKVVGKVEIIPPPGLVTGSAPMSGAWLLGIPAASRNKSVALDFLNFISSPDIQRRMCLEAGLPPTRKSVYQDPEVIAKYRWYPAQLEALQGAVSRPKVMGWGEIEGTLGAYLQLALVGEMGPEEALRAAQARIAEILAR